MPQPLGSDANANDNQGEQQQAELLVNEESTNIIRSSKNVVDANDNQGEQQQAD